MFSDVEILIMFSKSNTSIFFFEKQSNQLINTKKVIDFSGHTQRSKYR